MIEAATFVDAARSIGIGGYAGVPCSFLTPFINYVIGDARLQYVSSANEGDAVATAAGMTIAGRGACAMMQNSGLGNAVSPLTSLTHVFRIPVLVVCTHRGAPGVTDEPQHELMGRITGRLFETMQIPAEPFPTEADAVPGCLERIRTQLAGAERPYALVMAKGSVAPHALAEPAPPARKATPKPEHLSQPGEIPSRQAVLETLLELTDDGGAAVFATTGYTGRELYALDDRANHLYMVGSMGCVSSLALGFALARPEQRVVAIDGDGAALMRMGNLATIGACAPSNLVHVLLDNGAHDSTGAQRTVSPAIDFPAVAAACGYRRVLAGDYRQALPAALAADAGGPVFVHVRTQTGTMSDLPRPAETPANVLRRFMAHFGTRFPVAA